MKHANINLDVLDEPEFSEATTSQVGVWFRLYVYCARHENGGIILNAGAWTELHCRRLLGCARADLDSSPLWELRVSGLLNLFHYNLIAEHWSKLRRKTQPAAARSKSPAKIAAAKRNGSKGGRPARTVFTASDYSKYQEPTVK